MRNARFIVSSLVAIPFAPFAMAQEPAVNFDTPISSVITVSFPDSRFAFRPDADQMMLLWNAKDAALVTIRGRTSTHMPNASDERLALARALGARSFLIAHGVSPLKITLNFASAADFVADNSTPAGKRENQRVEVELVFVAPLAVTQQETKLPTRAIDSGGLGGRPLAQ